MGRQAEYRNKSEDLPFLFPPAIFEMDGYVIALSRKRERMKATATKLLCRGVLAAVMLSGTQPLKAELPDTLYHQLDEVEVRASRISQDVSSVAPLYKMDDERMKVIGVTDLTDALHRLPGLNIRDYGGAGGMKTVSARGLGSGHTGVIYDGVPLSDAQNGNIDLSRYSLDNVDDLSLVVGDNSDIFTSAKAVSSAASIILNTASVPGSAVKDWQFTGQLRVGSFGLVNPYIKVGRTFTPRFSCSAIGEYIYALNNYPFTLRYGIMSTRERRNNSRMSCGHAEINTRWRPTDQSSLDAKIYYYDNDRELPGRVVLYNNSSDDTLHDRNMFAQVSYLNTGWSGLSLRSVAKFNWDATFYHEVDGKYAGGFKDEYYIQREAYVSGSLLYTPLRPLSLDYAVDYSYNNLSSNGNTVAGPWRHTVMQVVSAKFNTSRLLVIGRLLCSTFINGVKRGEAVPDRTKLSPSVSVSVRPWRNQLIYLRASYKNIFRIPTFNESYYYHLGSLSLKPEDTDQINAGVTWQSANCGVLSDITATADVYYNHVRDKIVAVPQNMFVWTMTNLDKVRAFGADITLNAGIDLSTQHKLLIASTYSWQRVQPRTSPKDPDYNKQVAYTPQHTGAASVTWQNPWVDVVLKLTGCSDRYGTNSNLPNTRLPGYAELGLSLMRDVTLRGHSLDIRLDALNITDTQYQIVSGYPMPGCAFRLTATFKL